MRFLTHAALVTAGLLISASAAAETPPAAPAIAVPQTAPLAPAYPASPPYPPPGYVPNYVMYSPPGTPRPPWMPAGPAMERNSDAMRTTGKLLFLTGGVLSIVGGVMLGRVMTTNCFIDAPAAAPEPGPASAGSGERVRSSRQALNGCDSTPVPAVGVIVAGVLTAVAGIPLFVIGSRLVPARTTTAKLVPELRIGAASGSLRWSF